MGTQVLTSTEREKRRLDLFLPADVVAAVDELAGTHGSTRAVTVSALIGAGLDAYKAGQVTEAAFDNTRVITVDELLRQSPTPVLMLTGLAERGGVARLGELGQMASVGNTSRWKWQERLVAHGLITRDRQRATLTAAGWAHAERLRSQQRTAA